MAHNSQTVVSVDPTILATLKDLFRNVLEENEQEYVDFDTITPQTQLRDLPLNSLAMVELMYGIEERFHLHIPEAKAFEFQTFGDVIQCIQEEQAAK